MEPWCGEDIDKPDTCINFDKKMGFTILRIFGYIQRTLWKKIPPMPKSKSTYPTVVSDSTAHQKPSGDPFVNKGENWDAFERCSCHENQYNCLMN